MLMRWRSVSHPTKLGTLTVLFLVAALLASPALSAQAPSAAEALAAVKAPAVARISGAIHPGVPMRLNLALAGASLRLDLQPLSYRTPDFKLQVIENGQPRFVDPGPVRTVQGSIAVLPGARVLGVVKPSGLELTLTLPSGKVLEVKPLAEKGEKVGRGLYEVTPSAGAQFEVPQSKLIAELESTLEDAGFTKAADGCAALGRCGAKIIFDTDYPYFVFNASSVDQATATAESILCQVNQRFDLLNIRHELSLIQLRFDEASDPYDDPAIDNSLKLRDAIRDEWIGSTSGFDIDAVYLLAGRTVPGTGGESPLFGMCSNSIKYLFSSTNGSDCSSAVKVTHELGHSWGAIHTGGIMGNASASCSATWDAPSTTTIGNTRDLIDTLCLDQVPPKRASISILSLPQTMNGGQQYAVTGKVKNTGVLNWTPVGPSLGAYRLAQVGSTAWSPNRVDLAAPLNALSEVTFTFNVTAPSTPGVHNFQLQMVHEDVEFFGAASAVVPVTVLVKDAVLSQPSVPTAMVAGRTYPVSLTVQNTGNVNWSPTGPSCNAYRLGWVGSGDFNPVRVELPNTIAGGSSPVTLNFNITAPATAGTYTFQWRMLHECVEWFGASSPAVSVTVTQ